MAKEETPKSSDFNQIDMNKQPEARLDYSDSDVESFARALSKVTSFSPSTREQASKRLVENMESFGKIVEKASMFEMGMAALGAISSGFQADWLAYFLESFGELVENVFVAGAKLPDYIKTPMQALAKIFKIKNRDGSPLTKSEDFIEAQESLIGAINISLSSLSLANIAFRTTPKVLLGKKANTEQKGFFYAFATKLLPMINALFMWASGAGKRHITHAINEIHQNGYKAKTDGAWTSGMQDYYCGSNSLALMLRQAVSVISPKFAQICEPVFGTWISGSSFLEGLRALKNDEPDADYKLTSLDNSIFGKTFYGLARAFSKVFGLEMPSYTDLKDGIKNPKILLNQAA